MLPRTNSGGMITYLGDTAGRSFDAGRQHSVPFAVDDGTVQ
jgi:hypothetical protein